MTNDNGEDAVNDNKQGDVYERNEADDDVQEDHNNDDNRVFMADAFVRFLCSMRLCCLSSLTGFCNVLSSTIASKKNLYRSGIDQVVSRDEKDAGTELRRFN